MRRKDIEVLEKIPSIEGDGSGRRRVLKPKPPLLLAAEIYLLTNTRLQTRQNRQRSTGIGGGAGNGFLRGNKKLVSSIFALS